MFVLRSLLILALLFGSLAAATADDAAADETLKSVEGAAKSKTKPMVITPEREAAVLTFVRLNHPELEALLVHLKAASNNKDYERAIRELYRVTERLALIHDRDSTQYELELRAWKIQSRLQLLSAKMQMASKDDLKQQIKEALKEQHEVKAALLARQRQKLVEETKRIEENLNRLESQKESTLQKQLETLTREQSTDENKPSSAGKPTETKPTNRKAEVKTKASS